MICGYAKIEPFRIQANRFILRGESYAELLEKLLAEKPDFEINAADFRRGGERVRQAILGTAAALLDARMKPDDSFTILGCGHDGSFAENRLYFDDYTSHGRDGGRGQLFVATLPTTPLCEAAIALRMHGPAFYVDADDAQLKLELALCKTKVLLLQFRGTVLETRCMESGSCDF